MKKLGFGLMRLPMREGAQTGTVDLEQVMQMADLFLERGFTYFDTAWMYCGFSSENAVKTVLTDRYPRDRFTLATKLHAGFVKSLEDRDRIFSEQLAKTGAGYFDYYLLHGVEASLLQKYEAFDCFHWLFEKKASGAVKHVGISFHDSAALLDEILTKYPQLEFVQLQLNYLDWESPWIQSRACYETAVRHGKQVIVMEPVKGGSLAKIPAEAERLFRARDPQMPVPGWALRFAASLDYVMVVLSGMSSLQQVRENTECLDTLAPLTAEERQLCFDAAKIINAQIAVPCTGCAYCTEGCPAKIPIPQYFSLYNEDMREQLETKGWTINFTNYRKLAASGGKARDCIGCGACEAICPQHLPVRTYLKSVAKHYDRW